MKINNIKRILLKISGEMLSGTQEFGLQPEALELYAKKLNLSMTRDMKLELL